MSSNTTDIQKTLTDFPANPLDNATLPTRSYDWESETTTIDSLTIVRPNPQDSNYLHVGNDHAVDARDVAYVIDGVDTYIDTYGTDPISIPKYYSRYDDFTPHISHYTVANYNAIGVGITRHILEDIIRVATGGGRYSTDDLSVIPCGSHPFVVKAPDGVFIAQPDRIQKEPDAYSPPTTTIGGLCLAEETPVVKQGIRTLLTILPDYYGVEIEAWRHAVAGKHVFDLANRDDSLTVTGPDLVRLGRANQDTGSVLREYEIETTFGEEYTASWEVLRWRVGEIMADMYGRRDCTETPPESDRVFAEGGADLGDDVCVGYQIRWEDPRTSSRVSMSGRVKVRETYYYMTLGEGRSSLEVSVDSYSEEMAEFETEEESYAVTGI